MSRSVCVYVKAIYRLHSKRSILSEYSFTYEYNQQITFAVNVNVHQGCFE